MAVSMEAGMTALKIDQVSRTFPARRGHAPTRALEPTDLSVGDNDFVTILGPSGCGKSTLLRIIAGLDRPTSGRVILDGRDVTGPGADRGMVFQSYTLFPWLTVRENIAFGLREHGVSQSERNTIANGFINQVGLSGFENHWPKQLSGGMQQRTAIARALANNPKILLLDEPFEGLAPIIVRDLMKVCRDLASAGQTIVLVEQNLAATLALAQRIYIINNGHIVHEGPAQEIKAQPEVLQRYLGV